jgi:hypothetical protein
MLDDSSTSPTTTTLPTAYDVKDAETVDDDDDEKEEEELEERDQYSFKFETILQIKDQGIPIIVTVYPSQRTGYAKLDEKQLTQLKKF